MTLTELLYAYWPKLVFSAWFSAFNLILVAVYMKERKFILERFVTGFLVSPAFISIIGEQIFIRVYDLLVYVLNASGLSDSYNIGYISVNLFGDALFVFIGGMLFTYFTGLRDFLGASVYMEYVCLERLCLVVAVDYTSYLLCYIFFQFSLFVMMKSRIDYLFHSKSVNWKRIFLYLVGLFYILDLLYAAYLIFPELGTNVVNWQNIMWLDMVAFITCAFVSGYIKISISESKEHDGKIEYFQRLQRSQEDIIITLTEITEAKSGETGQHVRRVAEYSKLLALKLGIDREDAENLKIAAMMHDLGKLMISQDIIEKPDKLTTEEYDIVKQHTQYGWDILSNSEGDLIKMARVIAVQHHEYWDGNGYPLGLAGNGISIYAQIVAVADVFDALTSVRAYKDAWSVEEAKAEIIKQRGKQFSPRVVDAFIDNFNEICHIKEKYIDATYN